MTNPTKKSWRDVLPIHPAADALPQNASDVEALAADIKKHGLLCPVTLMQHHDRLPNGYLDPDSRHMLLDGRNRLDALERLGVELFDKSGGLLREFWQWDNDRYNGDESDFVISANMARRHLTADEKRDVIAKLLKAEPAKSDRQIAEQIKASPTTVGKARRSLEAAGDVSTAGHVLDTEGRRQPRKRAVAAKRTSATITEPAMTVTATPAPVAITETTLPEGFKPATHFIGAVRQFAEFCESNKPDVVAGGLMKSEIAELRQQIAIIKEWDAKFLGGGEEAPSTVPEAGLDIPIGLIRDHEKRAAAVDAAVEQLRLAVGALDLAERVIARLEPHERYALGERLMR